MKIKATLKAFALASLLVVAANANAFAQEEQPTPTQERPRTVGKEQSTTAPAQQEAEPSPSPTESEEVLVTDEKTDDKSVATPQDVPGQAQDVPAEAQTNRREQMSEEEAAVVPYYNNYLANYYLGPEDVISVTVFGQDRYSKAGIIVPPNGKISYPLVGSILVVGRTTEQVEAELTKKLDEYIIDPQVTVSLDKAMSARYSVLGDVAQPGVRTMSRRVSVYEALAEAGGVLPTGDKKKVVILRSQADGKIQQIPINISQIEHGKSTEMAYLVPGDQVVVPGNKLKTIQKIMGFLPIMNFARIFGLPY
ncbi:MAG TPA: polysaccharide biosynthesis/export family protein [Pyrinomonadaceae bacterium]|jgi:polysaccharide export outer membrane protein